MKKIMATLACLTCTVPAWAADVGIGISAESNDSTIFVPIDFGDSWRLEPFVNYTKTETDSSGYKTGTESYRIGTGIFGLKSLGESVSLYYGGRLSYLDISASYFDFSDDPFSPIPMISSTDGEGYRIAPTLGFEYAFNKHVSFGGEAEWFYEDLSIGNGPDTTRHGTETRLVLRFRF